MFNFESHVINTFELFNRLKSYCQKIQSEFLIIDTETNSTIEKTAQLYGIGLCLTNKKAFYIVWRDKLGNIIWSDKEQKEISSWFSDLCASKKLIMHNGVYDILVIENNLDLKLDDYLYHDTILAAHTIQEDGPFGLKDLGTQYFGESAVEEKLDLLENIKQNGGKTTKNNLEIYKADTEFIAKYCNKDVILTYELFQLFEKELAKENLQDLFYKDEVMPLYKEVTIDMKRRGFPVDVEYFKKLNEEITKEINELEDSIIKLEQKDIEQISNTLLEEEFPIKNTGNFPKALAKVIGAPLPIDKKTGNITLTTKAITKQKEVTPTFSNFYDWLLYKNELEEPKDTIRILYGKKESIPIIKAAREELFFEKYPEDRHIFNLRSNHHLIKLIVNLWGYTTPEKTEKGNNKIDDDFLEANKDKPFFAKLIEFKKLNKLKSTYIEGILERQIDGIIYTSMLQFGTTSGRYSSRDPNLQNIPRIKDDEAGLSPLVLKYTNAIKRGFIAPEGYKIVNADYSSLEPVCFAHVSGDEKLRDVFRNGEDLYSRIAIDVFNLKDSSANKKDKNYLKNLHPEARQKAKVFCLAVVYGAEEARIRDIMNISWQEAHAIINNYLNAYPNLRKYMQKCNYEAKNLGYVTTELGRKRHLKVCNSIYAIYGDELLDYKVASSRSLTDKRWEYKNLLNNAKNFKIQGLAAAIVNRAAIAMAKKFKELQLDASIRIQVHDELTVIAKEEHLNQVAQIMKSCMENTTKLSIPLQAEPLVADNWADAK